MATHLTLEERYQIQALRRFGSGHNYIARVLGRSRSTIDREVKRNKAADQHYNASRADAFARARATPAPRPKTPDTLTRPSGSVCAPTCIA
jgi:IS30 family transposase